MTTTGLTPTQAQHVVSFELPLPPSELMPNDAMGKRWESYNAVKTKYSNDCFALCKSARVEWQKRGGVVPLRPLVTMVLTFVLPSQRRRDGDGLLSAFKSGIDAMVAAKLLEDDSIWKLRIALEGELGPASVRVRLEGAP